MPSSPRSSEAVAEEEDAEEDGEYLEVHCRVLERLDSVKFKKTIHPPDELPK